MRVEEERSSRNKGLMISVVVLTAVAVVVVVVVMVMVVAFIFILFQSPREENVCKIEYDFI